MKRSRLGRREADEDDLHPSEKVWEEDELDEMLPLDEKLYQADFSYEETDENLDDDGMEFPPLEEYFDDFDGGEDEAA